MAITKTGGSIDTIPSPPARKGETFRFLATAFNVEKAQRFVEGTLPDHTVNVEELIAAQGRFVYFDAERIANDTTIDLRQGIILCPIFLDDPRPGTRGKKPKELQAVPDTYLVIDGWHRIRKAEALGVETLPAYVLTHDQGRKVRL